MTKVIDVPGKSMLRIVFNTKVIKYDSQDTSNILFGSVSASCILLIYNQSIRCRVKINS